VFIEERSPLGMCNEINPSLACDACSLVEDNIDQGLSLSSALASDDYPHTRVILSSGLVVQHKGR
jgi:hypothetical protein